MKRVYIKKRFSKSSAITIARANDIILDYKNQGFSLTLRQLYYQFVSRDIIPNTQKEYKRLGSVLNDARLAGLIDWSDIEDRTREMQKNSHWTSPESILAAVAEQFAFDRRIDQPFYIEVWIEKDALSGVIAGICSELDVPYFSCRGYTSQSEMHAAAMRFVENRINYDRKGIVLHLGDHDPSGIDMTRDVGERLNVFYKSHCLENGIEDSISVRRLALNMSQIQQYNPPPNPAKSADSRFHDYVKKYGKKSWELDALEPAVIVELIRSHVIALTDVTVFNSRIEAENREKICLAYIKNNYKKIVKKLLLFICVVLCVMACAPYPVQNDMEPYSCFAYRVCLYSAMKTKSGNPCSIEFQKCCKDTDYIFCGDVKQRWADTKAQECWDKKQ